MFDYDMKIKLKNNILIFVFKFIKKQGLYLVNEKVERNKIKKKTLISYVILNKINSNEKNQKVFNYFTLFFLKNKIFKNYFLKSFFF